MTSRVEFLRIANLQFDKHKGRLRTRELRVKVRALGLLAKAKCCKFNINIRIIRTFDN